MVLPALGGDVIHVDAVAPTCQSEGNIEYWFCPECEIFWADEALTQLTNSKNVVLPAIGSENVEHVEAVAPNCYAEGNIEYWFCPDCEKYWQDEALTQLTNHQNVKLGATGHVYVGGVCSDCGAQDPNVPPTGDIFDVVVATMLLSAMAVIAIVPCKKHN